MSIGFRPASTFLYIRPDQDQLHYWVAMGTSSGLGSGECGMRVDSLDDVIVLTTQIMQVAQETDFLRFGRERGRWRTMQSSSMHIPQGAERLGSRCAFYWNPAKGSCGNGGAHH